MTTDRTGPSHGELTSAGMKAATDHQADRANRSATDLRIAERGKNGRVLAKITTEQWDWVIERVSMGDSDLTITEALGLSRGGLIAKRRRDPAFAERYNDAVAEAFVNLVKDIPRVVRGEPGYSSGDTRRDELIAKYDLELAKRFARKTLGDHIQVDTRTVTINLPDWTGGV